MASRSCWSTKPANWTTEARAAAMNAKTIKEDQAQAFDTAHWPTEIKYIAAEKCLVVSFDTGETFRYPAEFLRVESPSAEVQGHGPGQKQVVARRRHVGIRELEPVGNYAVRLKCKSEERGVGTVGVGTCRSRGAPET